MQTPDPLETLLRAATRRTTLLYRGIGLVSMVGAAGIGLIGIFAPAAPGEELAKLVVLGMGAAIGVAGVGFWMWSARRQNKVLKLALKRPKDIAKIEIVRV
ncbi:MAG: hypothetical protein ACI8RZ_000822 [Myxococcota bacterium]|jgi:hypothetical protein